MDLLFQEKLFTCRTDNPAMSVASVELGNLITIDKLNVESHYQPDATLRDGQPKTEKGSTFCNLICWIGNDPFGTFPKNN